MINFYQSEIYTRKFFSIKKFEINLSDPENCQPFSNFPTQQVPFTNQCPNCFFPLLLLLTLFFFFTHIFLLLWYLTEALSKRKITKLFLTIIMRNVILAMFLTKSYREIFFQLKDLCRFMGFRCMEWCRVPFSIKCVGGEEKITFEFFGIIASIL